MCVCVCVLQSAITIGTYLAKLGFLAETPSFAVGLPIPKHGAKLAVRVITRSVAL